VVIGIRLHEDRLSVPLRPPGVAGSAFAAFFGATSVSARAFYPFVRACCQNTRLLNDLGVLVACAWHSLATAVEDDPAPELRPLAVSQRCFSVQAIERLGLTPVTGDSLLNSIHQARMRFVGIANHCADACWILLSPESEGV
jgi:hypothetical protein